MSKELIEAIEKKMATVSAKIYRSFSNASEYDKGQLDTLTWIHSELNKEDTNN